MLRKQLKLDNYVDGKYVPVWEDEQRHIPALRP